jgi:hypothetical protein
VMTQFVHQRIGAPTHRELHFPACDLLGSSGDPHAVAFFRLGCFSKQGVKTCPSKGAHYSACTFFVRLYTKPRRKRSIVAPWYFLGLWSIPRTRVNASPNLELNKKLNPKPNFRSQVSHLSHTQSPACLLHPFPRILAPSQLANLISLPQPHRPERPLISPCHASASPQKPLKRTHGATSPRRTVPSERSQKFLKIWGKIMNPEVLQRPSLSYTT